MRKCWMAWHITFILGVLVILSASPAFAQYFTIEKFHSDIRIRKDSSFIVQETIEVAFERPRHGIYREIPFKYRDDLGRTEVTPIQVLSVTDDRGEKRKYKVQRTGAIVNIRIGDPNDYVGGLQTYVITYRVENAILYLKDHDELYWNVTGNAWRAPIKEAVAEVTLVMQEKSKELWKAGYTGRTGSKGSDWGAEIYENKAEFFTKRPLGEGEGFTIAFGWDKGLVLPPPKWKEFLWAIDLKENWVFLLPFVSVFAMIYRWYKKGRDPRVREAIAVRYEPPKFDGQPLTPAEVGTLVDETFDPRDMTSSIVGLAVKGYIVIGELNKEGAFFHSKDIYLEKMKEPGADLGVFEKELMESLFPPNLTVVYVSSLKNRFYTSLRLLRKTLYAELMRKKYFVSNPENVKGAYVASAILIVVFGFLLSALFFPDSVGRGLVAWVLTALPMLLLAKYMPAKTRAGALAHTEILGFQEFMNRAEKDRLERMGDTNLFSKFLPYAIALDVVDHWAKAFEGIYQDPPQWYSSPGGFPTFLPSHFTHSLDTVTSSLSSAMFSSPRGSGGSGGGGGGGSSGGGFGGGGGGSW